MAPRKQPTRLEKSALKVVAGYCADIVTKYKEKYNTAVFVSYITVQEDKVCIDVPKPFFNDFIVMFLQRITTVHGDFIQEWWKTNGTAVMNVIHDDRLTKLERFPRVKDDLMHVLFCSMDRLKCLRYLHFGTERAEYLSILNKCNLTYITTFGCHYTCTDEVLRLIAEGCPNLTILDIKWSRRITSAGLVVLKRCSALRTVKLKHCGIQANDLISHLLSHDTIEYISHSIDDSEDLMSFSAGVYPKLKSLRMQIKKITNDDLDIIVRSFPSLDTLLLHANQITGDLRSLRYLPSLTSLSIRYDRGYRMNQIESLLLEVGNNYLSFAIHMDDSQIEQLLNLVYETCKNIKCLRVNTYAYNGSQMITIPPFENLETLSVVLLGRRMLTVDLQFTRLSTLKKLCLNGCQADLQSILLDHNNFPCIKKIRGEYIGSEILESIRNIIKENNLDVLCVSCF